MTHHPTFTSKSAIDASDFSECSLLEYLQIDPKPVLVFDVQASTPVDTLFTERHIFSNQALTSSSVLNKALVANVNNNTDTKRFTAFLKTSTANHREPDKPTHWQFGYLWTAVVLNDRWMVVSGVKHLDDKTELPADACPTCNNQTQSQYGEIGQPPAAEKAKRGRHRSEALPLPTRKSANSSNESLYRLPFSRLSPSDHLTFIREFDWASTSLGPIETWSSELRQACEMMIVNPDPCTIFWGDDLTMIWNEPYVVVAGSKHPTLFGLPARRSWGEVWDQYDPLFIQMRVDGMSFKQDNVRLLINRNGYLEEGFFNLRVMPVTDEQGTVVGFYEPVIETTRQVLAGRRLETLLHVSESLSSSTCIEDLWPILLDALRGNESDVFFAALYLLKPATNNRSGEDCYELRGSVGLDSSRLPHLSSAQKSKEDDSELQAAFRHARETKSSVVLRLADGTLSETVCQRIRDCGVEEDCRSIVISPLKSGTDASVTALLMIGTNPKREYDEDYGLFIQLLVRQIEGTLTFMELFEKERELLKEQANHQSQLRIQTFAESTQVGMFVFEPNGAIKFCNDAWLDLCGLTREQSNVPMSWVDTVHPENAPEIVQYWQKISNLEGPQTFEVQYKKPWQPKGLNMSLDRTYVIASAFPEVSESGELTGILGCVTDISHVKWAEKLQSQQLEEALELKRQQENFLDITSHEMRNPLNAILHCASELVENLTILTTDSPSIKSRTTILKESLDAASTVAYCGKHQKRIIDDVLTVSKLDSDLLNVAPLSSRPPQIVRQVLSVFETELRAGMIETEMEISESYREMAVDTVLIDPHRVIQIIINLFSNAIKFLKGESHRNLKIVIGAAIEEPSDTKGGVCYVPSGRHRKDPTKEPEWGNGEPLFLTFSVRDSGIGMTQVEANSLFQRFTQASPRTHVQYGGSGLGLFISRELAELHGGRIGLSSQLGSGSTFDFYVKGRRDLPKTRSPSNSAGSPPPQQKPHAIVARLRDSALASDMPPLKEVKSSPTVMQSKQSVVRVLIVEDNLVNQQILKKLMHKQGYQTSIANHGQEALDIILSSQWCVNAAADALKLDVVLCDVEMPVMGGKETISKVREMQNCGTLLRHIPVIAVTGNARPEQIRAALDCGFDDVVSKPYEVNDLLERVEKFTSE